MATLTISLPEAVLAHLKSRAEAEGTTPEAVVVADLEKSYPPKPGELLRKICGAYTYGERDVAGRVDELIGDGLNRELREFRCHGNPENHRGFDFRPSL